MRACVKPQAAFCLLIKSPEEYGGNFTNYNIKLCTLFIVNFQSIPAYIKGYMNHRQKWKARKMHIY